jgi:hypothetical protein
MREVLNHCLGFPKSRFFDTIKAHDIGGIWMKRTHSIIAILIMHIAFGVVYNLLLGEILNALTAYQLTNEFFMIRGFLITSPDEIIAIPQLINWLLIVSFVFFTAVFFIRRELNKNVSYRKASR